MNSVAHDHGYHALRVIDVVEETADTRTFVLCVPAEMHNVFAYRPGQFCTVRVRIDDEDVFRCYSMSSTPQIDRDLAVTVKRVSGGLVSNWLHDHIGVGGTLELMRPSGVFGTLAPGEPVVAFCGGSGVTPVFSIVKHVLATSSVRVKLLCANRDRASVIFDDELAQLQGDHPDRIEVWHHLDADGGFLQPDQVTKFVEGSTDAQMLICGPGPFMDLVEQVLLGVGVQPERIAIERFGVDSQESGGADLDDITRDNSTQTLTLTLTLKGQRHVLDYTAGDTILDAARRGGLKPPYSCELGNCASCMAHISEGSARMRVNNALDPDEIADGWVLTCQALPQGRSVTVEYENA